MEYERADDGYRCIRPQWVLRGGTEEIQPCQLRQLCEFQLEL